MAQAQDVEIPIPLSSGATDQPDAVQHGMPAQSGGMPVHDSGFDPNKPFKAVAPVHSSGFDPNKPFSATPVTA
ncbi:MAG: hypothetical protein ABSG90_15240, partial [Dehalococcoidia bacterium]